MGSLEAKPISTNVMRASSMRTLIKSLTTVLLLCAIPGINAAELKGLAWQQYQFHYPAGWSITRNRQQGDVRFIELLPSAHWSVRLLLTFFGKAPEPDQQYRTKPAMAGLSICLPMALQLAGKVKGQAISISLGSIGLATGPHPPARVRVLLPDHKRAVHLECFLYAQQGAAFSGIVRTDTRLGSLLDDQNYLNIAPEVFTAIHSIHIQP